MSTEEKKAAQNAREAARKARALSSEELASVTGGAMGSSRDGSSGGPEFQANLQDTTRLAKPSRIL